MKKKLAFLLGITPDLAFAAGNVALALRRHMPGGDFDTVVYHSGLAPADLAAFARIPRCHPVLFEFPKGFVETMLRRVHPESRFKDGNHLMTFAISRHSRCCNNTNASYG